ncbi:hypothetical protein Bbelb_350490 [Branchiostoma belcheri]|nr:hypothetical protein Bbelb_350490 [Branchiostoma belcheri]
MAHAYFSSGIRPVQYQKFCDEACLGQIEEKTLCRHCQFKVYLFFTWVGPSIDDRTVLDGSHSGSVGERKSRTTTAEVETTARRCRFFDELDAILRDNPTSHPVCVMHSTTRDSRKSGESSEDDTSLANSGISGDVGNEVNVGPLAHLKDLLNRTYRRTLDLKAVAKASFVCQDDGTVSLTLEEVVKANTALSEIHHYRREDKYNFVGDDPVM